MENSVSCLFTKNVLLIKIFCFWSDFDETLWDCSTHFNLMRYLNFWDSKNFWGAKSGPLTHASSVNPFNIYFLNWMRNSSFFTQITYSLTPSISNLVKDEARYFIKRFAWRLNEIRGSSSFEEVHLFRGVWLAERSINNQSEALSQMSSCDSYVARL